MNYRSIAQLNLDVRAWIEKLPEDIDLIVGIPRSGLLVANLLAIQLNRPFTDVDGLLQGHILAAGPSLRHQVDLADASRRLRVLVVDDFVWSGRQLLKIKQRLQAARLAHDIAYGTVYVTRDGGRMVDHYFTNLSRPVVVEWNVMKNEYLESSCVELDGVLCQHLEAAHGDDGDNYAAFLRDAKPLLLPNTKIGWLVTGRPEKYRGETETWLSRHDIAYGELRMLSLESRDAAASARHKAAAYRETNARLFIESSEHEAIEIARLSGRPVLCQDTCQMIYPGAGAGKRTAPSAAQNLRWMINDFRRKGVGGTIAAFFRRLRALLTAGSG